MTEFLDDILTSTPNILESDKDMHLNLERIKETPFEMLEKEAENSSNLQSVSPIDGSVTPTDDTGACENATEETAAESVIRNDGDHNAAAALCNLNNVAVETCAAGDPCQDEGHAIGRFIS